MVQGEPVVVDQQLSLTDTAIAHVSVSVGFSHEALTRFHTTMEGGKRGRIQVASSMMKGGTNTHMVMGSASLIRVALKKKIGMTNAEKASDRREKSIAWSSSYSVARNHRRLEQ